MTGAVDLSPFAESQLTPDERVALWARATALGVLVTVTALAGGREYFATVVGRAREATFTAPSAYDAASLALGVIEAEHRPVTGP